MAQPFYLILYLSYPFKFPTAKIRTPGIAMLSTQITTAGLFHFFVFLVYCSRNFIA